MRILEIGDYHYCVHAYPERTTLLWTGWRPPSQRGRIAYQDCAPLRFLNAMRDVRAGKYDLVVAYAGQYSPWHPRLWLRAFAREPWKPVATLSRGFGVSWLKFARPSAPVVCLDMSDSFLIGVHNFSLIDMADVYFKRELPADRWHCFVGPGHPFFPSARMRRMPHWQARIDKLRPLSLPVPKFELPKLAADAFPEKTVDIFFAGEAEGNSSVRRRGIEELKALAERGIRVDVPDGRLPWAEYMQRMARAWLTWSPEGVGWECYRPGEALQCRSVPLVNTPTIERYAPLLEGVHAFHYDIEPGGLTRAVEAALADKEKLKRMAIAGREFVHAHRTHRAIVDHVIETALTRIK
ncbi:MAG TPA: glycosyltransferase [Xanthobacteraceae bacterium]